MKMIIFALLVLVAVLVLLLLRKYTRLEFVGHASLLLKTWSVKLGAIGALVGVWAQSFPDAALHAWAVLPPDIKNILPPNIVALITEMEKRLRWYWRNPSDLCPWHMDETYVKVNGRWAYLYRAVDSRGRTVDFYLSSRRNSKAAYRFLGKILNNVKKWQIPRFINTDKAPAYGRALALLKREGRCHVIECDHGKLKRIIGATLGFKSMKTAYATIKGIEVMRALRKGQASAFYYGDPLGEMRLVSRVFEM
ncbi:IS6 family transposase [Klebsiella pneumoniae]|nr:IS6 family transposase [Klebsiella pneumoniae]